LSFRRPVPVPKFPVSVFARQRSVRCSRSSPLCNSAACQQARSNCGGAAPVAGVPAHLLLVPASSQIAHAHCRPAQLRHQFRQAPVRACCAGCAEAPQARPEGFELSPAPIRQTRPCRGHTVEEEPGWCPCDKPNFVWGGRSTSLRVIAEPSSRIRDPTTLC
jgi:hypothetical protein